MFNKSYNPDVLTCLANLSSDEVFTPPHIVNQMLDLLPLDLFRDKNTTFLDPVCKSGVFLREIAKRLMEGLKDEIPNDEERRNHIFKNQLYGIGITELTALLSRRSVYCSKTANGKYSIANFDDEQGNIKYERIEHNWKKGKCSYCGANQDEYERGLELETHAYHFIHTDNPETIFNMRFDVIIGNPPYQMNDGGSGASAKPIYHKFIQQSIRLKPNFLVMIVPSRWFAGGKGLNEFREEMLNDNRIKYLKDYENAKECFPGVSLGGGVNYFLWDKHYQGPCEIVNSISGVEYKSLRSLDEFPIFIRNNTGVEIVKKIYSSDNFESLEELVSRRNPFGFVTKDRGSNKRGEGKSYTLHSSNGLGYVSSNEIKKNKNLTKKYKILISTRTSEHAGEPDKNNQYRVLSTTKILPPYHVCTDSYIVIGSFDNVEQAETLLKYLRTKFVRFLLLLSITGIQISTDKFRFVPKLDNYDLSDKELYLRYNLSEQQIREIESSIKDYE